MDKQYENLLRRLTKLSGFVRGVAKISTFIVGGGIIVNKCNEYRCDKDVYASSTKSPRSTSSWQQAIPPFVSSQWDSNWDRRDPKSQVRPLRKNASEEKQLEYETQVANATPKASRHLLLIRHGQYFDSAINDKEKFLTNLGREQATTTGSRLKELDLPYSVIISSTMTRAVETANLIKQSLPDLSHVIDDSLKEGAPIPPDPPIDLNSLPEPTKFWIDGARIESAFRKYFYRASPNQTEDSYEIIVCHANVIRFFICRALQFPNDGWLRFSLAHGSLTHVVIRPSGNVHVRAVGDIGFMKEKYISFT